MVTFDAMDTNWRRCMLDKDRSAHVVLESLKVFHCFVRPSNFTTERSKTIAQSELIVVAFSHVLQHPLSRVLLARFYHLEPMQVIEVEQFSASQVQLKSLHATLASEPLTSKNGTYKTFRSYNKTSKEWVHQTSVESMV
eukprot:1252673-Amphidinium_carterae.1